ncbi:MAG: hypothetical protein ACTTH5_05300 [Wolinella sp.]
MRTIALSLAVLVSLVWVEALGYTQEETKDYDKQRKDGDGFKCL